MRTRKVIHIPRANLKGVLRKRMRRKKRRKKKRRRRKKIRNTLAAEMAENQQQSLVDVQREGARATGVRAKNEKRVLISFKANGCRPWMRARKRGPFRR